MYPYVYCKFGENFYNKYRGAANILSCVDTFYLWARGRTEGHIVVKIPSFYKLLD